MKPGQVVYFKKYRTTAQNKFSELTFKGLGFGVMLGHVQKGFPDPTINNLQELMNSIAWYSFDDIADALGEDAAEKVIGHLINRQKQKLKIEISP